MNIYTVYTYVRKRAQWVGMLMCIRYSESGKPENVNGKTDVTELVSVCRVFTEFYTCMRVVQITRRYSFHERCTFHIQVVNFHLAGEKRIVFTHEQQTVRNYASRANMISSQTP